MDTIMYYLIGINAAGFFFYRINNYGSLFHKLLYPIAFAGGSLGILLGIWAVDRKADKENMMITVFSICLLLIQICCWLLFGDEQKTELSFAFFEFFSQHPYLSLYLLLINAITFIVYGIDKYLAKRNQKRVKIVTLLSLAAAGGSIGGLSAMILFKHKIRKNYFSVGLPLILFTQLIFLILLMNR